MIGNRGASRTARTAALLLGTALGCEWEDADNDGTPAPAIDAGTDANAAPEAGFDASTFPCSSWTPPEFAFCGGSHCQQTVEELQNEAKPGRACAKPEEAVGFCSLRAPDTLASCTVASALGGMSIAACAAPKLPEYTAGCLDCFVQSAECAKNKCFDRCLNSKTADCDLCRVEQGCIELFYDCSGFRNPLP